MGYFEVLALPLVTFWAFNRHVTRLQAEVEQRQLRVLIAAGCQSPEPAKKLAEALAAEIGTTVLIEKPFDEAKFAELQEKLSGSRVKGDTHTE